jgi:hypothetical protein
VASDEQPIGPQPGPQSQFLGTSADIAIYGGAAGGGKSFALLLEPLRHHENPRFGGVIFRRTSPQLTGAGSLWEEASALYRQVGARMIQSPTLEAQFQSGALLQFLHLQHAHDVFDHQGKQYAFIGFDELTHFEASQFWYMVSRLRSMSGVRPYMRCTTNPDPDSFVRELIDWWIDENGQAIPERSGALRWFVRLGNALHWADSQDELRRQFPGQEPISLTFISARLEDNPALTQVDPGYRARLMAMPEVERERLLGGNWDVRPDAGKYIKQEYFARRWSEQPRTMNIFMASDFAVTEPTSESHQPDFTEHGVFGVTPEDDLVVLDWWFGQTSADVWIEALLDKVARWKPQVWFGEGGVIRKAVEPFLVKRMRERRVYCRTEWLSTATGSRERSASKQGYADRSKQAKAIRGRAFQARAAMGKVLFPANAEWTDRVIAQCVGFPGTRLDDAFDVLSHMCNAIDQAHPAIAKVAPKAAKRHDYGNKRELPKNWKVV